MKKACVSTNIAGCPECVVDGVDGFLCEPSDVNSLASAMKKVCAAGVDGVAKLGEAGCDFVNAKMDKNTQFWDFQSLFKELTAKAKPIA